MSNTEPKTTPDTLVNTTSPQMTTAHLEKALLMPAAAPKPEQVPAKVTAKKALKTPVKKTLATKPVPAKVAHETTIKKVPTAPLKTPRKPVKATAVQPPVEKLTKLKKPKLVRDSFTIPKAEYLVLDELKQRAIRLANPAKKSELLRAGIKVLAAMNDVSFAAAMKAVPTIKTGRPAKN